MCVTTRMRLTRGLMYPFYSFHPCSWPASSCLWKLFKTLPYVTNPRFIQLCVWKKSGVTHSQCAPNIINKHAHTHRETRRDRYHGRCRPAIGAPMDRCIWITQGTASTWWYVRFSDDGWPTRYHYVKALDINWLYTSLRITWIRLLHALLLGNQEINGNRDALEKLFQLFSFLNPITTLAIYYTTESSSWPTSCSILFGVFLFFKKIYYY